MEGDFEFANQVPISSQQAERRSTGAPAFPAAHPVDFHLLARFSLKSNVIALPREESGPKLLQDHYATDSRALSARSAAQWRGSGSYCWAAGHDPLVVAT
jgi:hypothetical protein